VLVKNTSIMVVFNFAATATDRPQRWGGSRKPDGARRSRRRVRGWFELAGRHLCKQRAYIAQRHLQRSSQAGAGRYAEGEAAGCGRVARTGDGGRDGLRTVLQRRRIKRLECRFVGDSRTPEFDKPPNPHTSYLRVRHLELVWHALECISSAKRRPRRPRDTADELFFFK
jgi:hypothetical protein